jgi:CHAP domain
VVDQWGYYNRECTSFVAWRLHSRNGFEMPRAIGNANAWGSWAQSHGYVVNSTPAVGAVAWWSASSGHVAWVEAVSGTNVTVEEYNFTVPGGYDERTLGAGQASGYIHFDDVAAGTGPPPPASTGNVTPISGHWIAGDTGQDFAYVTRRSDNGFDVAIWEQTAAGLVWKGVKWSVNGSSGTQFSNTEFIPADVDGDGLLDLYYVTSTNWGAPGFTVGLMHNNGNGLDYWGTKWSPNDLELQDVKFLPGDWTGTGRQAFAYVTRNSDNGFTVATFAADTSGNLAWQGVKWTQPGSSGVQFENTVFTPADTDGDGIADPSCRSSSRARSVFREGPRRRW